MQNTSNLLEGWGYATCPHNCPRCPCPWMLPPFVPVQVDTQQQAVLIHPETLQSLQHDSSVSIQETTEQENVPVNPEAVREYLQQRSPFALHMKIQQHQSCMKHQKDVQQIPLYVHIKYGATETNEAILEQLDRRQLGRSPVPGADRGLHLYRRQPGSSTGKSCHVSVTNRELQQLDRHQPGRSTGKRCHETVSDQGLQTFYRRQLGISYGKCHHVTGADLELQQLDCPEPDRLPGKCCHVTGPEQELQTFYRRQLGISPGKYHQVVGAVLDLQQLDCPEPDRSHGKCCHVTGSEQELQQFDRRQPDRSPGKCCHVTGSEQELQQFARRLPGGSHGKCRHVSDDDRALHNSGNDINNDVVDSCFLKVTQKMDMQMIGSLLSMNSQVNHCKLELAKKLGQLKGVLNK